MLSYALCGINRIVSSTVVELENSVASIVACFDMFSNFGDRIPGLMIIASGLFGFCCV